MHSLAALEPGGVAVVTGAASGIGLAAAHALARLGLSVCLVDLPGPALAAARDAVATTAGADAAAFARAVDVADATAVNALAAEIADRFGAASVVMNNAGVQNRARLFASLDTWRHAIDVNLLGVLHGIQAFVPAMIARRSAPGLVINTGSKLGVTVRPGDTGYSVTKAAVKIMTEMLQHELRRKTGDRVSAHLFLPGHVYTPLSAHGRERPPAAWMPDETVAFMFERLRHGDFYILCPDNEVDRATDERRIAWAAADIIENRPALSGWHDDYMAAYAAFTKP